MVSDLKSETARGNGAKSRDPTTPEGKEKSSRNSLEHGLTASTGNILLDCEDPHEFEENFDKLIRIHEPATPAENDIVEGEGRSPLAHSPHVDLSTGLLNAEIQTQQSKTDSPEPGVPLAMAIRN